MQFYQVVFKIGLSIILSILTACSGKEEIPPRPLPSSTLSSRNVEVSANRRDITDGNYEVAGGGCTLRGVSSGSITVQSKRWKEKGAPERALLKYRCDGLPTSISKHNFRDYTYIWDIDWVGALQYRPDGTPFNLRMPSEVSPIEFDSTAGEISFNVWSSCQRLSIEFYEPDQPDVWASVETPRSASSSCGDPKDFWDVEVKLID